MTNAHSTHGAPATTRGVVFVHACPPAIAPHVEWALAGVLGVPPRMEWTAQPADPGSLRSEVVWRAPVGTGPRLAASLRAWPMLVFEVTEEGTADSDGERLAHLPGRGFHRAMIAANGDIVVGEERLRGVLSCCASADDYRHALHELVGTAWDEALEPYRMAADGLPVALLHQVV